MKIISLEIEAFKRLRAVSITPNGNIVEVTGENGSGKSSSLDAIWAALGGKDASPAKPIHTGEEKAEIRLILGTDGVEKYKVTRRYALKEGVPYTTDLKLEGAEGARFDKPQNLLNTMVGDLCFDPLGFLDLPDPEQIKALRQFVPGVDFDQIEGLNKRDFEIRADLNRDAKSLRAQAEALPAGPEAAPERVDVEALEKQLGEAAERNTQIERDKSARTMERDRLASITGSIAMMQNQIEGLERERAQIEKALEEAGPLPELVDVGDVRTKLAAGRQANAAADAAERRFTLEQQAEGKEKAAAVLTEAMAKRKEDAAQAVQKANMPVKGLGFGDGVVLLNGEPLSQASRAQQIRASVAIAGAMNPKLRVAIIKDGSLLDKKSWAMLEAYAAENDLQVWVETVSAHTAAAILIEDGGSAAPAPTAPAADPGDVV